MLYSLNRPEDDCCDMAATQKFAAYTWKPGHKPAPPTAVAEAASAAATRAAVRLAAAPFEAARGPSPPIPPFRLDHKEFHVLASWDEADFPRRETYHLDGTLGSASSPVTLVDDKRVLEKATLDFSGPYHRQGMEEFVYHNVSGTLHRRGGGAFAVGGVLTRYLHDGVDRVQEFLLTKPNASQHDPAGFLAFLAPGPNPPPPPPPKWFGNCSLWHEVTKTGPAPRNVTSGGPAISHLPGTLYPSWPASSPWVTAVGATTFVDATKRGVEMATDQFGSGGGFSALFSRKDAPWQVLPYRPTALLPYCPTAPLPCRGRTPPSPSTWRGTPACPSGRCPAPSRPAAAARPTWRRSARATRCSRSSSSSSTFLAP